MELKTRYQPGKRVLFFSVEEDKNIEGEIEMVTVQKTATKQSNCYTIITDEGVKDNTSCVDEGNIIYEIFQTKAA